MSMPYAPLNPFAQLAMSGIAGDRSTEFIDQDYTYVVNATVPADGQVQVTVQIDSDSDFLILSLIAAQYTSESVRIKINDTNQRNFFSDFVNLGNFIPNGVGTPFPLPTGRVCTRGGRLVVTFEDFSGDVNTVQLLLRGISRYNRSR